MAKLHLRTKLLATILLLVSLATIIFFVACFSTLSPDSFYFPLQRLSEKAVLYTYINPKDRYAYELRLLDKRFKEVEYVVNKNQIGEYERSTNRLSAQVGTLTDYLLKQNLQDKKELLIYRLQIYKKKLEDLSKKPESGSSYWMLVTHSINSIGLNLEKLK